MKKIVTILIISIYSISVNAQKSNKHKKCFYCSGNEHQNESPYTVNLKNELPFLAAGIGSLGLGALIKETRGKPVFTISELNNLDANKINSFDRGAVNNTSLSATRASDLTKYASEVLPVFFLTNRHTRRDFIPLLIIGTEVYTTISGLTVSSKFFFNRPRPQTYNHNLSYGKRSGKSSRLSFFSGHTSVSAAMSVFAAKVINDYHPNMKKGLKIGLWSFALTLPAATGYFRVKGGKHFNSDVITGYTIGAAVGWLIPQLHKRKKDTKLSIIPFNYDGVTGLTLNWRL